MESRYYPGVEADVIKLTTELRDLFDLTKLLSPRWLSLSQAC